MGEQQPTSYAFASRAKSWTFRLGKAPRPSGLAGLQSPRQLRMHIAGTQHAVGDALESHCGGEYFQAINGTRDGG